MEHENNHSFSFYFDSHGLRTLLDRILESSIRIVEIIYTEKCSCLIHCSGGRDRTSQVCSLSQLMMDPFYRTIEGFIVLVEKDWISFGHQFRVKSGFNCSHHPIFLLFIDCVRFLRSLFVDSFEFNEDFLLTITHHLHSGLFPTFCYDTERKRRSDGNVSASSFWSYIKKNKNIFSRKNDDLKKSSSCSVIVPHDDQLTKENISLWFWKSLCNRLSPIVPNDRPVRNEEIVKEYERERVEYMRKMADEFKEGNIKDTVVIRTTNFVMNIFISLLCD